MFLDLLKGTLAGAAGTTALNAVTYLDMACRGRPASSAPEDAVERLAARLGTDVPGEGGRRENRVAGMAPLLGIATGVGAGAAYGALRGAGLRLPLPAGAVLVGAAAMAAADTAMAGLRVSDPRTWSSADWCADVLPHLVYGLVTAGACALFDGTGAGRRGVR
jgi:hypothetical protein